MIDVPMSGEDLRYVAKVIEDLAELLIDTETGTYKFDNDAIGNFRIPINAQYLNDQVMGYAILDDGWIGFQQKVEGE